MKDKTAYEMAQEWKAKYSPEMTEREVSCMAIGFVHGWTAAERSALAEKGAGK